MLTTGIRSTTTRAGTVELRPLRPGETHTVATLFERLGPWSRRMRFGGAKPRLTELELTALATVDARRHALVAYVAGDSEPAGIARLVVDPLDPSVAEAACAVADRYHGLGVGAALMRALVHDARRNGVERLRATILAENGRALALLKKVASIEDVRLAAGEVTVVASIAVSVETLRAA
jgi:GNAT superfamily N-acetyltransferase